MQTVHQPPREAEYVVSSLSFSTSRSSVVRWDGDSSGSVTVHTQAHKSLKINQKARQERQHKTKGTGTQTNRQHTRSYAHAHAHCAHLGSAELPWRLPIGRWRASASWSFAWRPRTNGGEQKGRRISSAAITFCLRTQLRAKWLCGAIFGTLLQSYENDLCFCDVHEQRVGHLLQKKKKKSSFLTPSHKWRH